jgi:Sec7-like guanine-nucleotide exchange factor
VHNVANLTTTPNSSCDTIYTPTAAPHTQSLPGIKENEAEEKKVESGELEGSLKRSKSIKMLVNVFNRDPMKGIEKMVSVKYLSMEADCIASFLLNEKRLSKAKIGEYLGGG